MSSEYILMIKLSGLADYLKSIRYVFSKNEIISGKLKIYSGLFANYPNDDDFKLIVYIFRGKIVGIMLYAVYAEEIRIKDIYVINEFRNKKIGSKMIKYLISSTNLKIVANVSAELCSFYSKNGFKANNADGMQTIRVVYAN